VAFEAHYHCLVEKDQTHTLK